MDDDEFRTHRIARGDRVRASSPMREHSPARVSAGTPAGGQFALDARGEASVQLDGPRRISADVPITAATARVLGAIEDAGGHGYLVGGCVRDALLRPGSTPKDVDIEAYGLEASVLQGALGQVARVDEVGKAFSVLTVHTGGEVFDVALPRTERRTGPGHRDFEIDVDPYADLTSASARRDFTVNALMYDPRTGQVIDCWDGLDDLQSGVLRHTTDAFAEDPLRVLRGGRFAARFGFTMDPSTIELGRSLAPEFSSLSLERVWGEWSAMASTATRPSAWLDVLNETGWIEHFPEVADLRGVAQDPRWHPEGDVFEHSRLAADAGARLADEAGLTGQDRAVVVFASMLHDTGKVTHTQHRADGRITSHGHDEAGRAKAGAFLARIGAPRAVIERVVPLVGEHMVSTMVPEPSKAAVRRLARRLAPATIAEWSLVVGGDRGGRGSASEPGNAGRWLELAEECGTTTRPTLALLTGAALIEAGMTPGPEFKVLLGRAVAAQDSGEFTDEVGARAWLAARLGADDPSS